MDLIKKAYSPMPANYNPIAPVGMPAGYTVPALEASTPPSSGADPLAPLKPLPAMGASKPMAAPGFNGTPTTPTVETAVQVPNTPAGPEGGMGQPPSGQQPNRANNVHAPTFVNTQLKSAFIKAGADLGLTEEEANTSWQNLYKPRTLRDSSKM